MTVSGTTHTNAGTYNGDAWSFAGNSNYNTASGTVNDAIGKATALITVTPYSVTYDGNAHTATFTAVGVESPTPVDLTGLMTVSGTTHTNAGTYNGDAWSFAGNSNYNIASGTVNDAIGKATATINITPYSAVYDANAHTASGTATGVGAVNLSAGLSFATSYTNFPGGNTAWSFSGGTNYNDDAGTATVTITKATLTITADAKTREYGDANPAFTGTYSGEKNSETFTVGGSTTATATSAVGTYSIVPSVTGATLSNYNVTPVNGVLTITKATLTITADAKTREYGDANPAFTGTYSGEKNSETFTVGGSTTATATSAVGTYSIVPSVTGATLSNYNVTPVNGVLTITKATLTITADAKTREYGDANPAFTGTYSGEKNSETFTVGGSTTATATSAVGTYSIVPSVTGATLSNYNITPVNGVLTVTKATLTITADAKSRVKQ